MATSARARHQPPSTQRQTSAARTMIPANPTARSAMVPTTPKPIQQWKTLSRPCRNRQWISSRQTSRGPTSRHRSAMQTKWTTTSQLARCSSTESIKGKACLSLKSCVPISWVTACIAKPLFWLASTLSTRPRPCLDSTAATASF